MTIEDQIISEFDERTVRYFANMTSMLDYLESIEYGDDAGATEMLQIALELNEISAFIRHRLIFEHDIKRSVRIRLCAQKCITKLQDIYTRLVRIYAMRYVFCVNRITPNVDWYNDVIDAIEKRL